MKNFFKKYIANYAASRTASVLATLSDKQLKEIGLERNNLEAQLKKRFSE